MSASYDFRDVTHFTAGAVGDPGQRVFFLQLGDDSQVVTVRLEKEQVNALAQFLKGALNDLPSVREPVSVSVLKDPIEPIWAVGQISVGVDESESEVVLVVEELTFEDDEEGEDADPIFASLEESPDTQRIRARIKPDHAASFVATSDELMVQGRPPCFLCGQPVDPNGHNCPRLN